MSNDYSSFRATRPAAWLRCFSASLLLLIVTALGAAAQNGTLEGYVYEDGTGDALPGVNVHLDGTTTGTATDRNGFYRISGVPAGSYTLVASFVGYSNAEANLDIPQTDIDERLYDDWFGRLRTTSAEQDEQHARSNAYIFPYLGQRSPLELHPCNASS